MQLSIALAGVVSLAAAASAAPAFSAPSVCVDGYKQTQFQYTHTPSSGVYAGKPFTGAAASSSTYITYKIVHSDLECLQFCDSVNGCVFANSYQALYPPGQTPSSLSATAAAQYQLGNLTCALFRSCLPDSAFTNDGGQNSVSFIVGSDGYCKSSSCPTF